MDNIELYSELRKVDSKLHSRLCELDSKLFSSSLEVSRRIFTIWLVMLVGFELFALLGLVFVHRSYVDSVDEARREIAALQLKAQPMAVRGPSSTAR